VVPVHKKVADADVKQAVSYQFSAKKECKISFILASTVES
jgi:hypothetical protein